MTRATKQNLIRLCDAHLDRLIYRIYSLDRFTTLLTAKKDAVVNPAKWRDPFEDFFLERTAIADDITGTPISLSNLAGDWCGQCWSFNSDTDAMWRIYGPNPKTEVGVKVRTTIRKLFKNLKAVGSSVVELQFFVGKVAYLTEAEITSMIGELTFTDVAIGGQGDRFADLLCINGQRSSTNRKCVCCSRTGIYWSAEAGRRGGVRYPLDAATVFEEVVLDPRLEDLGVTRITEELRAADCSLPIHRSTLYQTPYFTIPAA